MQINIQSYSGIGGGIEELAEEILLSSSVSYTSFIANYFILKLFLISCNFEIVLDTDYYWRYIEMLYYKKWGNLQEFII